MPAAMQPLGQLQPPASDGYNSYSSSALPGFQHMVPQTSASSHPTPQHRQKSSTSRAISKSLSAPSSKQSNHKSSATGGDGRTIYIYNLPHTVDQKAIEEHVASVVAVSRCNVIEDRQRSSKYKLTAVVTFRTPQQAQLAIDRLNRSIWKGYEIKVRLDKGPSAPSASALAKDKSSTASRAGEERREMREVREPREGPLVVNGSGPTLSNRQIPVDSDDETSCDDSE
jgi:RNA recognition motif-containing protein